jgi:hypothetical protein
VWVRNCLGGQMNHKLLNKTLKIANRELRAELKQVQIELERAEVYIISLKQQVKE